MKSLRDLLLAMLLSAAIIAMSFAVIELGEWVANQYEAHLESEGNKAITVKQLSESLLNDVNKLATFRAMADSLGVDMGCSMVALDSLRAAYPNIDTLTRETAGLYMRVVDDCLAQNR